MAQSPKPSHPERRAMTRAGRRLARLGLGGFGKGSADGPGS